MKQFYLFLSVCLLCVSINNSALAQWQMQYVNDGYLTEKQLMNEKMKAVLCDKSLDGQYYLTGDYLSVSDRYVTINDNDNGVEFKLVPAAKISNTELGRGRIQDKYIGADGIERKAPTEYWNNFLFTLQPGIETIQLYYFQREDIDPVSGTITYSYLTSSENGKLQIKSAVTEDGIMPLTQMFVLQGYLNVQFFQPPFYGYYYIAPIIHYDVSEATINATVSGDNPKQGHLINKPQNTKTDSLLYSGIPTAGLYEFALVKTNSEIRVTNISLNEKSVSLTCDDFEHNSIILEAALKPENASNKSVVWKSDNDNIASVSENGEVFAKSTGNAHIIVTSLDGKKTDSCLVSVNTKSELATQTIGPISEFGESENMIIASYQNNQLTIQSGKAEPLYIYSITGELLHSSEINEGRNIIPVNCWSNIVIVRGGTGWVRKIVKQY